ncbi:MAG: TRAP transporter large permease [Gammaproteobacteria bacterium]|nr:TRAP transporter large permease [Gammaproteobacteria bacterium]
MTIGVIFFILLFAGLPIALVLATSALVYIWLSGNFILFLSYPQQLFSGLENYGLLAIPLFMLTGELMNKGGVTRRLVSMASIFVGGFKGGLIYVNLVANTMMAAIIGSAAAQISVMSKVMVPEMEKRGYSKEFAAATTAAGGLLSPIIPPSMVFVIYGVIAQIAIGDLFIAGIVPGLILAVGFIVMITILGLWNEYPRGEWPSVRESIKITAAGLPAFSIPVVIIGGILLGIASPTESAALATVTAFVVGRYIYKKLQFRDIPEILQRTALNSALVIFLIAAANVFGWIIIYEKVPQSIAVWLTELTSDPLLFLLTINLLLIGVGMIIDAIAAMIIIVPILLPIATLHYGIDPIVFGVIICLNLVLGLLTPPVGAGLFIISAMAEVTIGAVFKAIYPFILVTIVVLVLLTLQPWLITLLL